MTVGELREHLARYNSDMEVKILAAMDYNEVEDVYVEDSKEEGVLPTFVVVSEG